MRYVDFENIKPGDAVILGNYWADPDIEKKLEGVK